MVDAMEKEGLPRHFLYLSLQESNFNPRAIGPETRFGIAKGAWQFLPTTGEEFGLRPGGLAGSRVFDDEDERFNFEKATYAAARYLKHIYTTEAQASGLLVMAGYNFGHNRVKSMIRKMPQNPKDRNFWRFFKTYEDRIPQETKDYVFYIFSAAVIGEDPKFFGFDFKSPSDVL
jgi:soluble lytic murein transglycosylase-like protein